MRPFLTMISWRIIVLLFILVSAVASKKLPNGITPCSRNDPELNACALRNGRRALIASKLIKGIPSYQIPPLDPLHVTEISIDDPGAGRQVSLALTMKDVDITGLKNASIDDISVDLKKNEVWWKCTVPRLSIIGKYSVNGRVLLLPLTGNGDLNVTLDQLQFKYVFSLERGQLGKDGKEYIGVSNSHLDFDVKRRAYLNLENLFNGDKRLSDQMNIFLNENWREMISELGPPVAEALNVAVTQIMVNLQKLVPFDDIFVDTPPPASSEE